MPVDTRTARMDLSFSLSEQFTEDGEPAGIGGAVEFRTDVFDAATIESLIERLRRVLVAMTTDPAQRLSSVDVLDGGERARLDEIGNRAVLTRPGAVRGVDSGVVRRTRGAHARSGGDRPAASVRLTYRELDEASNRLAHLLAAQRWGPGRVWRCCWSVPRRRSWRCWRCSRPGRRIWRSTRRCRRPGSSS